MIIVLAVVLVVMFVGAVALSESDWMKRTRGRLGFSSGLPGSGGYYGPVGDDGGGDWGGGDFGGGGGDGS